MSVPAANVMQMTKIKNMEVAVHGRVSGVRRIQTQNGSLFLTLITTPAADEYSSPSTLEVQSSAKLGEKGDEITVSVKLSGYKALQNQIDKETGERTQVQTA